jgi:hypothetical protein
MRLSSAVLILTRVNVTRATNGGGHSLPLLQGVEMVDRKKSTMTLVNAPSGGTGRYPLTPIF